MYKVINSKPYELKDEVVVIDPYSKKEIVVESWMVNPGFKINNNEVLFDVGYSEYLDKERQFYFLHIPRTSGMSVKYMLMKAFSDHQIYSNFIQMINNYKMSGSKFISGHFAQYPIDLAKSNKQEIVSYTVLRDPLDRYISNFLYTLNLDKAHSSLSKKDKDAMYTGIILDNPSFFIDALYEYSENPLYNNVQHKHLTHTVDLELATKNIYELQNNIIDEESFYKFLMDGKDLKPIDGLTGIQGLDRVDLVDIVGITNHENLKGLVAKNFNIQIEEDVSSINQSFINSKDFIKKLPTNLINHIVDSNKDDYELYEYAIVKRS